MIAISVDLRPVKLKPSESMKLPHLFFFDPTIPSRILDKNERVGSYSHSTIALSIEVFRYANCFPVPYLIEQLCRHFDLSPSQLMPHVWRVVAVADVLGSQLGFPLDLLDVLASYSISEVRLGIYTLVHNSNGYETCKTPSFFSLISFLY